MTSGGPNEEVLVAGDVDEHAAFAAERMGRAIKSAVDARGVARVALSGGTTPADAYRRLSRLVLPWESIDWFWVDERAVAPDSPRSNYRNAYLDLGLPMTARGEQVHRMEADDPDLEAAAERYERLLRDRFGVASAIAFDVMTLGIGDDGHTASLFPRTGLAAVDDCLVQAVRTPPEGLEPRLTLTAPVLREARLTLILARGVSKRDVVKAARSPGPEDEVPARIARAAKGRVVWILDHEAAGA